MQYSEPTNRTGIVEMIRDRLGTDEEDYAIGFLTQNVNKWFKLLVSDIQEVDASWQFDDRNLTTLPIESVDIVAGQRDYQLDADTTFIERVEIKQEGGEETRVLRRIHDQLIGGAIDEVFSTDNQPLYFDLLGDSILLFPTPDYSVDQGLTLYVRRGPSLFTIDDTTKEPGINALYHDFFVEAGAYEYAKTYKKDIAQGFLDEAMAIKRRIVKYYARRGGSGRIAGGQRNNK